MTREELDIECTRLERETAKRVRVLRAEWAIDNSKYGIGDIIEDHYHIIKVEKLNAYESFGNLSAVYTGIELKKDLTPKKRQSNTTMHETNVIGKLN